MPKLNSIEEEWREFSAMIFNGVNPSPVQVEETRRAFYAGVWVMVCMARRIGAPDVSELEGVVHLTKIENEVEAFYKDLMRSFVKGDDVERTDSA